MFETLGRPYKERGAEETISHIRGLLRERDLLPAETSESSPFPGVFSASLVLAPEKGGFRTNGKGRTREYCWASAYAEYMERLQNGLYATFSRTMLSRLRKEFGFYYDPRERFMPREEFDKLPEAIITDLIRWTGINRDEFTRAYFERIDHHGEPGTVAIPFFSWAARREEYLPLNLLLMAAGSNGMAAGNSLEEAIFQALCELMERWGAAEVFYGQLTPPTVPEAYLRQFKDECEIIDCIERSGKYKITVKDFSARKRIPAIGLIVRNIQQNTYRLNAGSDTSFQVALSRCLTEVFQGIQDEEMLDHCMLKVPTEDPHCFTHGDEAALNMRYLVFSQFTKDNSGVFPMSLFGEEPSYPFTPETFAPRASYRQEVDRLSAFLLQQGYPLYVRDVSYLGFPSVFVYVPHVSTLGRKNAPPIRLKPTYDMIEWDKAESRICNLRGLSTDELVELAGSLQTLPPQASVTDLMNIKLKNTCPWSQLTVSFLLAQVWYRAGRLADAVEAFKVFLSTRPDKAPYYETALKYLELRAAGRSPADIRAELEQAVEDKEAVKAVCDDLDEPAQVFGPLRLPECPNCESCQLSEDCLTRNLLGISRAVYPAMKRDGAARSLATHEGLSECGVSNSPAMASQASPASTLC